MKKTARTIGITLIIILAIVAAGMLLSMRGVSDFHEKYEGVDLSREVEGMERGGTYEDYLRAHEEGREAGEEIEIDLSSYENEGEGKTGMQNGVNGRDDVLFTDVDSRVSFHVNVPDAGFYCMKASYLLPKSRGVAAEREVRINGELPFEDARDIAFTRIWTDNGEKRVDNQGNEIRPMQMEVYDWQDGYFHDDMGYVVKPYQFWLEKGENTISLYAENEPMIFSSLSLTPMPEDITYAQYAKDNAAKEAGDATATDYDEIIQGEDSSLRSESSLYAKYDRSSPTTEPSSVTTTVLNYSGGDTWSSNGQWIEWDFEVPEDGFYHISIKGRQNYSRGSVSSRRVLIDGKVPFAEMEQISFPYSNDWNSMLLSDENGKPYEFYLTRGGHTIRLEATLGGIGPILEELQSSTYRLNEIYRRILVYTGATPDQYRDYHIDKTYPEIMDAMELESKRLYHIVDETVAYSGQKADNIATAQTVAQQLERFCEKPNRITTEFTTFKDNITALGTASLNMSETKLDVDYIEICGTNVTARNDKTSFAQNAGHEIASFIASFFVDYNSVGDVYTDADDAVKVWVLTGRDQGTILKSLVDDEFTPDTGIPVNVEIVDPGALLNAVLAGRGPNVVLSVGADQPVNYALRKSAEDLTQFDGWQEVLSHYSESSYEQYRLDDHIYAIPETQTFNVMFYRKDVLAELGLEPPDTWQELLEMLPTIQGNNLTVGIPTAAGSSGATAAATSVMSNTPDLSMYFDLLFQYGGDMYNEKGTKTTVNDEAGIEAFNDYVRYFNDYGIPTVYDFVSRFRTGEMPIGIAAYSTYNTLMVSAPEIKGLWDFTLIPGTEQADGTIDRSDFITGSATMMITTPDETTRNNSWEFMKWWAEPDTQVQFGREIEALLGSSARYATANRDAFEQLSWSQSDIRVLNDQWDQTRGIREVPGGYFTGRHISNAIRKCINEKVDGRETIIDYAIKIDDEITKKRKEFGMPVE